MRVFPSMLTLAPCALLIAACADRPTAPASPGQPTFIVNGVPTGSDFPSVGALLFNYNRDAVINGDDEWCTGSVIAPDVFLTAAHCVISSFTPPLPLTPFGTSPPDPLSVPLHLTPSP